MKKLFKPLIVVLLILGMSHSSAVAQNPSNETTTTRDIDRNDDSSKWWGLLGLLGLLGLVGYRKNEKTTTYSTTNTPNR